MTSDRSRRVRRCYCWGFGAVLAAAAGAGAQQSGTSTSQPDSRQGMNQQSQQGWQSADYIPQLPQGVVVLCKEDGNRTTQVTVQDGRVVAAEVDGQFTPPTRVQVQGNKLRILDENNQVASTIRIPNLSGLAMGGMNRPYGTNERFDSTRDRYNDRYTDRGQQSDWYSRDRSQDRGQDRFDREDWRLRDQDPYNRQDTYRQDTYRQDMYRQDTYQPRYDSRYDNRQGNYDSRYDNRGMYDSRYDNRQGAYDNRYETRQDTSNRGMYDNRQGYSDNRYDRQQDMRSGRVYGTTESARPALALGIMSSEASTTDLGATSTGTRYTQGIRVEQVQEGMPAASSGLQKGDIIVAIDGRTPATTTVLHQRLQEKDAGDTVQLRVLRNGTEQTIPVKLERIDYGKYNWDFMGNPTTVDQGRNTVDQDLLQQPNKQEIYRPSQDGTGNNGQPLWDRVRDRTNNSNSNNTTRNNPR